MSDFDDILSSFGDILANSGVSGSYDYTSPGAINYDSINQTFGALDEIARLSSQGINSYTGIRHLDVDQQGLELHRQQINTQIQSLETQRLSIATIRQNAIDQIAANFQLEKNREEYGRKIAKESAEYQRLLDRHPLITLVTPTLEFYESFKEGDRVPPLVIISPPALEFDPVKNPATEWFAVIESDLTDSLRDFLAENYPLESNLRPTKFMNGYRTKAIGQENAVEILHWTHQSIPTLFVESKLSGDKLRVYLGYWEKMEKLPHYKKIVEFSRKDILYPLARTNAQLWQKDREKLLQLGRTEKEVEAIGGINEINLRVLLQEEQYKINGIDRKLAYKVDTTEYNEYLLNYLSLFHRVLVALVLDRYYILNYRVRPHLPEVLDNVLQNFADEKFKKQLLEMVVGQYRLLYLTLEGQLPHWIPDLALDLAASLVKLQDKNFFRQQIVYSITFFLRARRGDISQIFSESEQLERSLSLGDVDYFEKLDNLLKRADKNLVPEAENLLQRWFVLKAKLEESGQQSEKRDSERTGGVPLYDPNKRLWP